MNELASVAMLSASIKLTLLSFCRHGTAVACIQYNKKHIDDTALLVGGKKLGWNGRDFFFLTE